MKKSRFLVIILAMIFFCLTLVSCGGQPTVITDYKTQYSEEEHIQRISEQVEERFYNDLQSGEIVNYQVELIHSFISDDPRFFMLQFEYAEEFEREYKNPAYHYSSASDLPKTITRRMKHRYIIGYIQDEEYRVGLAGFCAILQDGKNPYEVFGHNNAKKYFGRGVYAVEIEGKRLRIFEGHDGQSIPAEFETREEYTEQYYMKRSEEYTCYRNTTIYMPTARYTIKDLTVAEN